MVTEKKDLMAVPVGGDIAPPMLSVGQIKQRMQQLHDLLKFAMRKEQHYGVIPGTNKPSLWKAGAEKIATMFGLRIEIAVLEERITEDEVFYRCRATARNGSGDIIGTAEGVCSTSEKKYRWREPVHPKEYAAYPDHRKRVTYSRSGAEIKQVRQEPGDLINTLCQMAGKRAFVQVIRTATGATDIFAADPSDDRSEAAPEQAGERPPLASGPVDLRIVGLRTAKTGERDGKTWTLFAVKFSNGKEATTFSEAHAELAEKAYRENLPVTAEVSEGKKPGDWKLDMLDLVPA
jgi:hypothetical protein